MAKNCETFEHTADVGLAASADSLGELFEALGETLADYICPRGNVEALELRRLSATADDVEGLTVDFLTEVMNLIQADHFAVAQIGVTEAADTHVSADVWGEPHDPARHEIHTEVKAVTYHQLSVERDDDSWTARVILDL